MPWVLVAGFLTIGCGGGESDLTAEAEPTFKVRGSVQQIQIWKTPPASKIEVHDAKGAVVFSGTSDTQGSLIFRNVPEGDGYEVTVPALAAPNTVKPIHVSTSADSLPTPSFYSDQKLVPGFNYITTRDGTKLAAYITLPGPREQGPLSDDRELLGLRSGEAPGARSPATRICAPSSRCCATRPPTPSALIAALMGYATVSVNMRGTGCSGGAYDYFEELQKLDGYDAIETVAAQSWVQDHRVGMTGLSYPGISQLFVARTHPPSLAAITPLSVIGDTYSTAVPGRHLQ